MRLGARTFTHNLGWDDLAITIATILLDLQTVFTGLVYHAGGGRHQYYLSPSQTMEILRWNYASEVLLFAIIPATKISICLFVLRIKNTGWLKWLIYGLMAGLVITTVVPIIVLLVQCRPIEAFWNKSAGSCWSPKVINDVNYAQVAYSIVSDCVCSLLPIIILWNVQMHVRMKIAVCGLMSLGLIATACAAVRMSLFTGNLAADLSWNRALISIWCGLEECLGIICANLALSRFIYLFLRNSGWKRKSLYPSLSANETYPTSTFSSPRKKQLDAASQDTVIPLRQTHIRKTTKFYWTEETASGKSCGRSNEGMMTLGDRMAVEDSV